MLFYIYYKMCEALGEGGGGRQEDRKGGEGKSRKNSKNREAVLKSASTSSEKVYYTLKHAKIKSMA